MQWASIEHSWISKTWWKDNVYSNLGIDCPIGPREKSKVEGISWNWRIGFLIWRTTSTLVSPKLDIYLFTADVQGNKINLSATIMHNKKDKTIKMKPLLDCRAGGIFMDQNFTWKHGIRTTKLDKPITAQNIDRTLNKKGTIRYFANLKIKIDGKTLEERFYITGLGDQRIILGFLWLKKHNP